VLPSALGRPGGAQNAARHDLLWFDAVHGNSKEHAPGWVPIDFTQQRVGRARQLRCCLIRRAGVDKFEAVANMYRALDEATDEDGSLGLAGRVSLFYFELERQLTHVRHRPSVQPQFLSPPDWKATTASLVTCCVAGQRRSGRSEGDRQTR